MLTRRLLLFDDDDVMLAADNDLLVDAFEVLPLTAWLERMPNFGKCVKERKDGIALGWPWRRMVEVGRGRLVDEVRVEDLDVMVMSVKQ